ncbi:MAG: methyl-accepting chemotaxis protein [Lachnospiraceae bacterium]|nr:methyl-accepting chemotaxis protein [Lachnospiraceae bacterium]
MKKKSNFSKNKNNEIKKTNSIIIKLLFPTLLIITILTITLSYITYTLQKRNLIQDAQETTTIISHVAANLVNPNHFTNVRTEHDTTSSAYSSIFETLSSTSSSKVLSNIYSLYLDKETIYYGIDTNSDLEIRHKPGETYDLGGDKVYKVLSEGNAFVSSDIIIKNNKNILYSITPVKNANDLIVGAIGCEYDVQPIYNALEATLKKLIITSIISIIISSALITFIIYSVLKKINSINDKMITIVNNEGDLTQYLDISSRDTLGSIADHTNTFISSIRNYMLKIKKGASNIDKSAKHSYSGMQVSTNHINSTDNALEVINTSMTSVVDACSKISNTSTIILNTINSITRLIHKGVDNAINIKNYAQEENKNNTLKYEDAKIKASILAENLNKQLDNAREITKIAYLAKNILEITDQTNILALNASIESAKAGEHGKGFSIVAEEIIKLAYTTNASASQIQAVTRNVITSVNDLTLYAEKMLIFLNKVLFKGFEDLVSNSTIYANNSQHLSNILLAFADSTSSLSANIEEVQSSLKQVIEHINSNVENIETITVNSKDLNDKISKLHMQVNVIKNAGEKLNKEVNRFRV